MAKRDDFDSEYARLTEPLPDFGIELRRLMERLLTEDGTKFHRVDYRVKSKESAARKIAIGGGLRTLDSFTDLLGIRIITYFRSEMDSAAAVVKREFTIDKNNSVDKRAILEPDRFGYLSLHFVARLSDGRASFAEYKRFRGIAFEVQIRSILQHAWAEIEHDLGYKAEAALPPDIRRRFARLAAALELADNEFIDIRSRIGADQAKAIKTIADGELNIEIDHYSLSAFVQRSGLVKELDTAIAKSMSGTVRQDMDREFIGRQVAELAEVGFHSIEELSDYIKAQWDLLKRFTEEWLSRVIPHPRRGRTPVPTGIAVYYAGLLKHAQDLSTGNDGGTAYSGISPEPLLKSLRAAMASGDPQPGGQSA